MVGDNDMIDGMILHFYLIIIISSASNPEPSLINA